MKIDKIDSKQVPQVIALAVLCVGVFGFAGFRYVNTSSRTRAAKVAEAPPPPPIEERDPPPLRPPRSNEERCRLEAPRSEARRASDPRW